MIWLALGAGAGVAALGTLGRGVYSPNSRLFGPVIGRGPRSGKALYLTFDDGPSPSATPGILATLAAEKAPAAFFMVGEHARRNPELARRVVQEGHAIGNHTQSHRQLHFLGPRAVWRELQTAHDTLVSVTGSAPRLFRAPHGFRNPFVTRAASRLGYCTCGWTFGVWDTARPGAEEIRRRVRLRLRPGAIVLLHDGDGGDPQGDRSQTAAALPGILADALQAGYEFRPLTELLAT